MGYLASTRAGCLPKRFDVSLNPANIYWFAFGERGTRAARLLAIAISSAGSTGFGTCI
jgi:hypothetical protein